jgi:hypothetical protein
LNAYSYVFAQDYPTVLDDKLRVDQVVKGLRFPTSMDFLAADDILVLEKDNGTVRRIVNGTLLKEPVLDVDVANKFDRGLLGIAISKNTSEDARAGIFVFLYMT